MSRVPGTKRNAVAEAAMVHEHEDGSRTIYWTDGMRRRYSRETIAAMFLDGVEKGAMNPLLERLLTRDEMREMYAALVDISGDLPVLIGAMR